jgi:hypothetical protein
MLGLAAFGDGPLVKLGERPFSYQTACECPDDCLRDHENE